MSAAVKPNYSLPDWQPELRPSDDRRRQVELRWQQHRTRVESLVQPPKPNWLAALIGLKNLSTGLVLLLVGGLLPLYGWSNYTQHSWGKAYSQLEQLQRQERQLLTNNEIYKYQVAEQAETQSQGLIRQTPLNTLFLPKLLATTGRSITAKPSHPLAPAPLETPVGY